MSKEMPEDMTTEMLPALGETVRGLTSTDITMPKLHDIAPADNDMTAKYLLNWIEGQVLVEGAIPTIQRAVELGADGNEYAKWLSSRPFRKLLSKRGIAIDTGYDEDRKPVPGGLTELQYAAIAVYTDINDNRSYKVKLSELDIDTQTWQNWLHDPEFVKVLHAKSESELLAHKHEAIHALLDEVRGGNLNAIKYYNEMIGRYINPKDRVNSIDPMSLIQQFVEILQEESKDPELTRRIGERLMSIIAQASAQHVANG